MLRAIFSIALLFVFTSAHGASFNCAKARTEVEKIVCSDQEISSLDSQLGKLYNDTYHEFIRRGYMPTIITGLVREQKDWLKSVRDVCKDAACVKQAYVSRINDIGSELNAYEDNHNDESDDMSRALALKCDYSADPAAPVQRVSVEGAVYGRGTPAAVKEFSATSRKPQHLELVVKAGQVAECIYPSGFRVRLKVGEGQAYPYGQCGADAEVFLSLWVNERKVDSSVWFAGHCRGEFGNEAEPVSYTINAMPCRAPEKAAPPADTYQPQGHTDICVNPDFLKKYAVDAIEYPPKGVKLPKVGDFVLVQGNDDVCGAAKHALMTNAFPQDGSRHGDGGPMTFPEWEQTEVDLPQANGMPGGDTRESTFDFDNDGKLDRVISLSYMTHYMDASVLLVQPGKLAQKMEPVAPLQDPATLMLPCQVTGTPANFAECPPFTQTYDEAGFAFGQQTAKQSVKDPVYFRSRYTYAYPFFYKKKTYVLVSNRSADVANYTAVLKPLPHRKFEHACLIKQVEENF